MYFYEFRLNVIYWHFHTQVSLADICPVGSPKNELWIATNFLFMEERHTLTVIIIIYFIIAILLDLCWLHKKDMTIYVKISAAPQKYSSCLGT